MNPRVKPSKFLNVNLINKKEEQIILSSIVWKTLTKKVKRCASCKLLKATNCFYHTNKVANADCKDCISRKNILNNF